MLTVLTKKSELFCLVLLLFINTSDQYTYNCNTTAPCGCSSVSTTVTRIVGGEEAATSTWGWAVSIYISPGYLCGGSILSSEWIITAAHCVNSASASQITVYAGSNTRWSGQSRSVSALTVHPNYISSTYANDIALLKLSTALDMTDSNVKMICMPSVTEDTLLLGEWPSSGLYVQAVGWGRLSESGSLPTSLQQVSVKTIDYTASTCSSSLNDRTLQFCAGVNGGGKDTCQGDSGGPLMMYTTSYQWVLVGITSYGQGCARENYMGVYTRVAYYQSWINSTTNGAYTKAASSVSADIDPYSSSNSISMQFSITLLSIFVNLYFYCEFYYSK